MLQRNATHDAVSQRRTAPTLVLGLGNLLLRDEGVGVRVVQALQECELPAGVECFDGATYGVDLIEVLADREHVIVIDALDGDLEPGTVLRLRPDDLAPPGHCGTSVHDIGFMQTLALAERLGCAPRDVTIIGVQPGEITPGLDLTPAIETLLPKLVSLVQSELSAPPVRNGGDES